MYNLGAMNFINEIQIQYNIILVIILQTKISLYK